MIIRNLPFYRRLSPMPIYPAWQEFPPPRLDLDVQMDDAGMVMQRMTPLVSSCLADLYGRPRDNLSTRACPADNTNYYLDFWSFLQTAWGQTRPRPKAAVDVGCGDGFLVSWLKQWAGYAVGLERTPRVNPTPDILNLDLAQIDKHSFDLIVHHHVLEHVLDPLEFLCEQREAITDDGLLIFAVPNCEGSIRVGDVSMLLHQHVSYFTTGNLSYLLQCAGFQITCWSHDASTIFIAAKPRPADGTTLAPPKGVMPELWELAARRNLETFAQAWCSAPTGEIGVYCPLRALPYLAAVVGLDQPRLFDDALHGHFMDGMRQRIERMGDLVADPPRTLFIMSLTHGDAIADKVETQLEARGISPDVCKVITLADLVQEAVTRAPALT